MTSYELRISDWSADVYSSDLLQQVNYPALAGVPRDFVEYPSQVNENWLMTPEVLSKYATHYKTGAPMPQALVDKILASNKFNQGFDTVEYLARAIVDMKDRKSQRLNSSH